MQWVPLFWKHTCFPTRYIMSRCKVHRHQFGQKVILRGSSIFALFHPRLCEMMRPPKALIEMHIIVRWDYHSQCSLTVTQHACKMHDLCWYAYKVRMPRKRPFLWYLTWIHPVCMYGDPLPLQFHAERRTMQLTACEDHNRFKGKCARRTDGK